MRRELPVMRRELLSAREARSWVGRGDYLLGFCAARKVVHCYHSCTIDITILITLFVIVSFLVGSWCLVLGGWLGGWLVAGGWWLVTAGWWLVTGGLGSVAWQLVSDSSCMVRVAWCLVLGDLRLVASGWRLAACF